MTVIIQNSWIWRGSKALFFTLVNAWQYSALGRLSIFLKQCYKSSVTGRLWIRFCSHDGQMSATRYGRAMEKLRNLLFAVGSLLRHSLFYRFVLLLRDLYFLITKGSLLFGLIHKLSLHQWLLVAFGLYLPLEFIIRDVIGIGIVASLWEEAFILAAAVLILWRKALGQSKAIGRETPVDAYLLLFMAVGFLLMSLVAPHPAVAFAGYRAVVVYMVWFFLLLRLIEDDKDFKVVFYTILFMGALLSLHGIYQYIVAVPIPAGWVSQTEMGVRTRVFSLTGSPNIFGSLIVLTAPLAAAMIYYCKKIWAKLFFLGVTGLMCLCLLFTFSRGAWVGMVVAVILFALFLDRRLLVIMGAAVASVLIFVPSITSRLTYLFTSDYAEASAVGGRALRWAVGRLLLMEHNPWTGFGLGRFGGAVAMNNQLLDETEEFSYFYMDNYYLKTMVEMGYIGIAFFLLLLAGLLIWALRAVYRSGTEYLPGPDSLGQAVENQKGYDPLVQAVENQKGYDPLVQAVENQKGRDPLVQVVGNKKAMAVGIFSGLCGVLVHCYFENIFEEPYMMAYFWGMAAMLMYLGFFSKAKTD